MILVLWVRQSFESGPSSAFGETYAVLITRQITTLRAVIKCQCQLRESRYPALCRWNRLPFSLRIARLWNLTTNQPLLRSCTRDFARTAVFLKLSNVPMKPNHLSPSRYWPSPMKSIVSPRPTPKVSGYVASNHYGKERISPRPVSFFEQKTKGIESTRRNRSCPVADQERRGKTQYEKKAAGLANWHGRSYRTGTKTRWRKEAFGRRSGGFLELQIIPISTQWIQSQQS